MPDTIWRFNDRRVGCPDSDGDGISDADGLWNVSQGADAFRYDATQSADSDGDGYGDNASGNYPDACPSDFGDSWQNSTLGCPDADQDGWPTQDSHLTISPNGPMWMEMVTVTIQVGQHLTLVLEMMVIQQRATATVALTPMVMAGMTSSTNCLREASMA